MESDRSLCPCCAPLCDRAEQQQCTERTVCRSHRVGHFDKTSEWKMIWEGGCGCAIRYSQQPHHDATDPWALNVLRWFGWASVLMLFDGRIRGINKLTNINHTKYNFQNDMHATIIYSVDNIETTKRTLKAISDCF